MVEAPHALGDVFPPSLQQEHGGVDNSRNFFAAASPRDSRGLTDVPVVKSVPIPPNVRGDGAGKRQRTSEPPE
jgi:hypothetical protein